MTRVLACMRTNGRWEATLRMRPEETQRERGRREYATSVRRYVSVRSPSPCPGLQCEQWRTRSSAENWEGSRRLGKPAKRRVAKCTAKGTVRTFRCSSRLPLLCITMHLDLISIIKIRLAVARSFTCTYVAPCLVIVTPQH